jgi:hypothetical protein
MAVAVLCGRVAFVRPAAACDLCAIYTGTTMQEVLPGFSLSIAQQYTSFDTLQLDGDEIDNFDNERLQSSITQFVVGYTLNPRVQVGVSVPLISRHYRRTTPTGRESGDETGIGDIALLTRWALVQRMFDETLLNLDVTLGVKLPTGDTDRLGEETPPEPASVADAATDGKTDKARPDGAVQPRHSGPGGAISGVHGHDLTLGTGSVDFLFGASLFTNWKRAFFSGSVQYMVRHEGDYDYRYANDLQWEAGPGAYALLHHDYTLAVQAEVTGESKGKDEQNGVKVDDTAITALYVGPKLAFTYKTFTNAEIAFALPVIQNTTDLQIVPDYRLRAAWTWRF